MIKFISCVWVMSIIIWGCNSNNDEELNQYFPTKIGTSWQLILPELNKIIVRTITVDSVSYLNGNKYYRFKSKAVREDNNKNMSWQNPTRFFRIDKNGDVYEYIEPSKLWLNEFVVAEAQKRLSNIKNEQLWYKFSASEGESWYAYGQLGTEVNGKSHADVFKIILESKSDTVVTPLGVFRDCYKFVFQAYDSSHQNYFEWFAKGIGLIKRQPEFLTGEDRKYILTNYLSKK